MQVVQLRVYSHAVMQRDRGLWVPGCRLMEHWYNHALAVATDAALKAGAILRKAFHRPGGPSGSGGHCPADATAESVIRETLLAAFPGCGYLGEETDGRRGCDGARHIWLVDPKDGTSSFRRGMRGSAVSIALLREGVPVLGVVYAFAASDDEGDLFAWAEGCSFTRPRLPAESPLWSNSPEAQKIVLLSQDADRNPEANLRCIASMRYRAAASIAYRLVLVAAREGVAAVSLNAPCCWDYAAGRALIRAVGGELVDQEGRRVQYSRDG